MPCVLEFPGGRPTAIELLAELNDLVGPIHDANLEVAIKGAAAFAENTDRELMEWFDEEEGKDA